MLSGSPPFSADTTPEYVYKHINVRPITLFRVKGLTQRVPPAASRVVMRCLEKDPNDRFQSATELCDVLQKAAKSSGVILRPGSAPTVEVPRIRDKRPFLVAGAALAAILAVTLAVIFGTRKEEKKPATTPAPKVEKPRPRPRPGDITVQIRTTPAEAEVVRITPDRKVLGLTPLKLRQPPSQKKWNLLIRAEGYQEKKVAVTLDQNQTISLELKPAEPQIPDDIKSLPSYRRPDDRARTREPRERKPGRRPGSRRIINPFD
jgi:serine/threonine protein kinase